MAMPSTRGPHTNVSCAVLVTSSVNDTSGSSWIEQLAPDYIVKAVLNANPGSTPPPPGPYFLQRSNGRVFQAYKLYDDTSQAFIQSSYQDPEGTHWPLRAAISSAGGLTIGVPSRLYFTPTADKPLAGLRLGIKDLYDLKGLKTSGGSRALFDTSTAKTQTAYAVQKLIDAGAVVVGKNKLSEFAFAGPFVTDHIDYLLPFNPRGDGYNSPGDSSGGSGAAVASYSWLDASMGSDTGGSIRGPASNNGVHGNRPTQNAVNLTGALVLSYSMDTSGILARDPDVWSKINKVLYSDTTKEFNSFPTTILLDPSTSDLLNQTQTQFPEIYDAMNSFIEAISEILSANASEFSIDQAWNETGPASYAGDNLNELVQGTYGNLTRYEQWTEFGKNFVETYMDEHGGAFPHMSPSTREGWFTANRTMDEQSHEKDLAFKSGMEEWSKNQFLAHDNNTCSEAIYLYFRPPVGQFSYKLDVTDE